MRLILNQLIGKQNLLTVFDILIYFFNYKRSSVSSDLAKITDKNINLYIEFANAAEKYSNHKCLGTRSKISIVNELQSDGKILKKFNLKNSYDWLNYSDVLKLVDDFSRGLLNLGLMSNEKIAIFSETRYEWLVAALACFKIKVSL